MDYYKTKSILLQYIGTIIKQLNTTNEVIQTF